jgi:hypothetical protein
MKGHSLLFEDTMGCGCSQEGHDGAFRTPECDDAGSPGFARGPLCLSFIQDRNLLVLKWRVVAGRTYVLQSADTLGKLDRVPDATWKAVTTNTAASSLLSFTVPYAPGASNRFYRLRELP